ncbi:BspA family leucine-rich repeat surface protein [Flavobacterium sp. C4GT6]|uniref:BspA family leucine-rich repeat surface protein n=1 Tax=Flavobacterium sp. C4GT6 TaxID=3103818 RepID=UPI002ED0D5D4
MKKNSLTLLLFFLTSFIYAQEPFITVWQATAPSYQINIPIVDEAGNNYTVDFGDGTVLTNQTGPCSHVFESIGGDELHTVTISGTFGRIDFSTMPASAVKLYYIQQWGDVQWTSMEHAFFSCYQLIITATDTPDLSQVTSMEGMFHGASNLNSDPEFPLNLNNWDVSNVTNMKDLFRESTIGETSLDNWDVSNVTNMEAMFADITNFNGTLNSWDVSSVTNMKQMFYNTQMFNQPLDNWDVSNVTDMSFMFNKNDVFNQPLNSWDVSSVTNMEQMFGGIESVSSHFNQPLDNWDVSSVVNMKGMFADAVVFNQSIDSWDVSSVTDMSYMFYRAYDYNQPLNSWDVSSVANMRYMFNDAHVFNQPLNSWDVSSVTDMRYMFTNANNFDQSLNNWDVSSVTTMERMFTGADVFNGEVANWDVSNVVNMGYMFGSAELFNQPLNNWDVSNVTDMHSIFADTNNFNQPLNNWDVSNVIDMNSAFSAALSFNQDLSDWDFSGVQTNFVYFVSATNMSTANYDALLLRFAEQEIENQLLISYYISYCDSVVRNYLINDLGWNISEDEQSDDCEVEANPISGYVFFDEDNNGCANSDVPAANVLIKATNGNFNYITTIDTDGYYEMDTFVAGTYEIEVIANDYFTVSPEAATVTFTGTGDTEELNFCVTANQSTEDLNITILPVTDARPGFEAEYQLVVENMGTQTVTNATLSFTYNDAMQSFVSAVPAASSNSDNVLTFDLIDFQPFESRVIDITMETFTPPTVNGDDILNFTATVTPNENDYTPQDNTFEFAQTVVNSFDPNDKSVVQGSEIYIEQATEYLDYIIRFQNTGTASAINIRVEDILSDDVDWSTFRPVSSSHDYRIEITDDNHVEFIFENINLPFEGEDEAGSNGFIAYKIKPVDGLEVGDIIHSNEVNIYFDYNLPIVTNSVTTQIIDLLGISYNILNKSLVLYPNPANDILYIKVQNNVLPEEVVIYNLQGRELMSFNQNLESMDITDLSSGIYLVTVQTNSGRADYRLVKK